MTPVRSSALALVTPADAGGDARSSVPAQSSGRERRAFTRLSPFDLKEPLTARLKYGETITLLDVSAGGALFETSNRLRPEADLVLELTGSPSDSPTQVVSRILRCEVVGLRDLSRRVRLQAAADASSTRSSNADPGRRRARRLPQARIRAEDDCRRVLSQPGGIGIWTMEGHVHSPERA
jgi:hypothetical protein